MQKFISFYIFFFLLLIQCVLPARLLPPASQPELTVKDDTHVWQTFSKFKDAGKGANFDGISELKKYFHKFGYLNYSTENFTNTFEETLETAVLNYQKKLGLRVTGILDSDTITQIITPRCGVPDHPNIVNHYTFFEGNPRWKKQGENDSMTLTYAFSNTHMIDYISYSDIQAAIKRSFARWAAAIPVNFKETNDYFGADIKIAFLGNHSDAARAFDGVMGVLAHALTAVKLEQGELHLEKGQLHFDTAETWSVDFKLINSTVAIDLESVATHEIGHILGLQHSSVNEAVMYPSVISRTRKVDLKLDDIEGIQKLYGSNKFFRYTPSMGYHNSLAFRPERASWFSLVLLVASFI